jgi:hypothetical protein
MKKIVLIITVFFCFSCKNNQKWGDIQNSENVNVETTIIDSTENGFRIFKKMQKNADEILFYNSDYFNRIGFPNTEVIIGKNKTKKLKQLLPDVWFKM